MKLCVVCACVRAHVSFGLTLEKCKIKHFDTVDCLIHPTLKSLHRMINCFVERNEMCMHVDV